MFEFVHGWRGLIASRRWPTGADRARSAKGSLRWPRALVGAGLVVLVIGAWLATTDDVRVWPVRNTLQYHAFRRWPGRPVTGVPVSAASGTTGTLRGALRDPQGQPIAGARVLVSRWDGTTHSATSDPDGVYVISGIPAGNYVPVAGAPGYADTVLGRSLLPWPLALADATRRPVPITPNRTTLLDGVLRTEPPRTVALNAKPEISQSSAVSCDVPIPSTALRQQISIAGLRSPPVLLYTPVSPVPAMSPASSAPDATFAATSNNSVPTSALSVDATAMGRAWPLLLTVYPGPANEWECASLPLAQAGYAVLALGPAYSFELEQDVDDLVRLLGLARAGLLPGVDGTRAAALGGSYSALHVLRALTRGTVADGLRAVVLLGAPADLFDIRRRYEDGSFVPPFGLDQALIALGLPDRVPLRYWRYSGVYHVRRDWPPVLLVHSRDDAVVPFQQSEQLAAALTVAGVPHQLHVFNTAGHYLLAEGGEAQDIYRLTVEFLGQALN